MANKSITTVSAVTECNNIFCDDGTDIKKITPKDLILNAVYPVGSIYMSVNSTSPKTLFGGTWVQIKDRFLLSAGTTYNAGATGGEASHTLTVNEMPSHKHEIIFSSSATAVSAGNVGRPPMSNNMTTTMNASAATSTGGGQAHNNMPPYLAVYMWKRTA